MRIGILKVLVLFSLVLGSSHTSAQTKQVVSIDCSVSGISIETLSASSKIQEKLIYEYGETKGGYKYSKTEFKINGNELKDHGTSVIAKSDSYILLSSAKSSGKGFNKKVYMFTNFYDLEAKEVMRQVTTFPDGTLDKTVGNCTVHNSN